MKIWHYLILIAVAVLLVGSFFLPNAVAGVTDSKRLENLIMVDSQSISFDSAPELDLPERLTLIANPNTEILPLKTGNAMDADAAKLRINQELERLFLGSPFQFDFRGHTVEESLASLVIDSKVPTHNMIVWELVLIDSSENSVTATLDDETGLILKLIYKLGNKGNAIIVTGSSDDAFYSAAQSLAEMMKKYYGFPVTLADYEYSKKLAYYRADLFGGGRVIPMYGAVRASSFTINERGGRRQSAEDR